MRDKDIHTLSRSETQEKQRQDGQGEAGKQAALSPTGPDT